MADQKRGGKETKVAEEKKGKLQKILYIGVIAILAIAVLAYLAVRFGFLSPNRSVTKTAKGAFTAAYEADFEEFMKRTVYSDDCQKYLRMEVSFDITQIEAEFKLMEGEKDGFTMTVDGVTAQEFNKDSESFNMAVALLKEQNPEAVTDDIEKVARAEIKYRLRYTGENLGEAGTETYWLFRIKGMWYCHPLLEEVRE